MSVIVPVVRSPSLLVAFCLERALGGRQLSEQGKYASPAHSHDRSVMMGDKMCRQQDGRTRLEARRGGGARGNGAAGRRARAWRGSRGLYTKHGGKCVIY